MRFSEHRRKCGDYVDLNPGLPPFFERYEVVFNLLVLIFVALWTLCKKIAQRMLPTVGGFTRSCVAQSL